MHPTLRVLPALLGCMLSQAGLAADLPVRAPPAAVIAEPSWRGCYAGVNAGFAWANAHLDGTSNAAFIASASLAAIQAIHASAPNRLDPSGFTGGAGIGCNLQDGRFVFGLETDINYTNLQASAFRGPFPTPTSAPHTWEEHFRSNFLGTVRGRLGYTFTPGFLVYATGGLAYAKVKFTKALDFPCCIGQGFRAEGSESTMKLGWTVGGGFETVIGRGWTARLEYLYVDLGTVSAFGEQAGFPGEGLLYTVDVKEHLVRAGLNYRF